MNPPTMNEEVMTTDDKIVRMVKHALVTGNAGLLFKLVDILSHRASYETKLKDFMESIK